MRQLYRGGRESWERVPTISSASQELVDQLVAMLAEVLELGEASTAALDRDTGLFGNLPELDSMAVATLLTALEDHFDILIEDDEVSAELFETVGSLADFIATRQQA